MALVPSGAISLGNVRTELAASGAIGLGNSNVRTLFGVPSGAISMSQGYGKANAFTLNLAGINNVNVRTQAIAGGWNQTSKLYVVVTGIVGGTVAWAPALLFSGSFPGGVTLTINSGAAIYGYAGLGGTGGASYAAAGGQGGRAGHAIQIDGTFSTPGTLLNITNNGNVTAGGGGGGGGGGGADFYGNDQSGGAGGRGSGFNGSSYVTATTGQSGSGAGGGAGAAGHNVITVYSAGMAASMGMAGINSSTGTSMTARASGGYSGCYCLGGDTYANWLVQGTIAGVLDYVL